MSTDVILSPRLRQLERVIERGMASFVEVGNALLEIRSDGRWEEGGYVSFDAYCSERWGFGSDRARQFIAAAKTVTNVTASGLPSPSSEGQARELLRAPEEQRAEVWAEVVEQHAPAEITGAVIREHAEARKPTPAPAEVVQDAEVLDLTDVLDAIAAAVHVAKVAGATSNEMYDAYQRGLQ